MVCLQRVGEEGLRLGLEVPEHGEPQTGDDSPPAPRRIWWSLDDSRGFHQLAALVSEIPHEQKDPMGLRFLLEGCMRGASVTREVLLDQAPL